MKKGILLYAKRASKLYDKDRSFLKKVSYGFPHLK